MNHAAVNVRVPVLCGCIPSCLLGIYLAVELLGCYGNSV